MLEIIGEAWALSANKIIENNRKIIESSSIIESSLLQEGLHVVTNTKQLNIVQLSCGSISLWIHVFLSSIYNWMHSL